jgi:peptide/nickel transport system substrate-binding protein
MRTRTRRGAASVVGVAAFAVVVAACGSSGSSTGGNQAPSSSSGADTYNSGTAAKGGSFTYTLEKDVPSWNVNSALGNTFETDEVVEQIYPSVWNNQPDLSTVALNKDLMVSAQETSTSPETITYKIQPNASWSDGKPIDANDFIYFWKTQDGKDCPKCQPASTTGYEDIKSITGSNGGKTVTVVFAKPFGDWKALFGGGYGLLPSHLAKGTLDQSFNKQFNQEPTVSGGPFELKSFKHNQNAQLVRNPKYYGTPASLDTLNFRIITDATQEPTAIQNGEVDAIYPQPELDLLTTVEGYKSQGIVNQLDLGLNWEHFDFNLNNPFLKDAALRQALFTALNRQQLINQTVGQFDSAVKPLNNRFFMPQQTAGYQDNITKYNLGNGDLATAKSILQKAGYTGIGTALTTPDGKKVPTLAMKYTVGNTIRQTECQIFASTAKKLGVNVAVSSTDDLGATLTHADKQHDYDVVVFAWVGAPFPTSGNAPNYITGAGNNFGAYSNKQVDSLLARAVKTSDPTKAAQLDNQADQLVSKDAYTLPLYQKPTFLAVYNKWVNIRDNATGQGPPYNAQQWGSKDQAT